MNIRNGCNRLIDTFGLKIPDAVDGESPFIMMLEAILEKVSELEIKVMALEKLYVDTD